MINQTVLHCGDNREVASQPRQVQPLLILGTRPFSLEIADVASEVPGYEIAGFVENLNPDNANSTIEGKPVYWVDDIKDLKDTHVALCGLGTTHRSKFTDQVDALGISYATLVHPLGRVSTKSTLGEGTIVSVLSIVAAYTTIGKHVIVNRGCIVGHHTTVGNFVSIMTGATIAGDTRIGDHSYIGMAATIRNGVTIGRHAVIGAGAVVTKDVPDRCQVVGVPARIVKENIEGL